MLKKLGTSVIVLVALLILLTPPQASARIHFGVYLGGPVYAYPPYPYYAYPPYPYPYYSYPNPYNYRHSPYIFSYRAWDHGRRARLEHRRHERRERELRGRAERFRR
ncbi:MAG: hypothetical protein LAP87_29100 [Acidobacteriia bacterium]|nr:hypothetical protein [Terriglobia bacterium]